MGLRCEFLYKEHPGGAKGLYESGFPGRCVSIKDKCCILHMVNKNQMRAFQDVVVDKPLILCQHGIDEICFDRSKYRKSKNGFVIGVSGRDSVNKGFGTVKQACDKCGITLLSAQYNHNRLPKERMPEFYNAIDTYVCFSVTEGLHNGTLEAGAMGIPVISTRCGAAEEIIRDGENGLLIDRTEQALVDALNKMKDEKVRIEMGNKLHEEVMKNWTWKVRVEDFRKMFQVFFKPRG